MMRPARETWIRSPGQRSAPSQANFLEVTSCPMLAMLPVMAVIPPPEP
jgi:hypothetical protein